MKFYELISKGAKKLKLCCIQNSSLDSEILLCHVLNITREEMILNLNKKANRKQITNFNKMIIERLKKKPIAYLINKKNFWKTQFYVNKSVLIPRPDSEILVSSSVKLISKNDKLKILDIGTGTGCIIISILLERKNCTGIAIDISKSAINIAKTNAKMQQLENRIRFFNSDIDNFFFGKYDFIVSNPPYIKRCKLRYLDEDVKNFEPYIALDGGLNGITSIEKVIKKSKNLLKLKGKFVLEIDHSQVEDIKSLLMKNNFYINQVCKDLNCKYRCIISTKIQ